MKTKTFDAIEMKRQGSRALYRIIGKLTTEEQLAFWQQRTNMLLQQQRSMTAHQTEQQPLPEHMPASSALH